MEATVLKRTDGVLGIVGQASDPSVGGGVFTDRLVAFCAKDFKRRTGGLDIFESKRSVLKVCTKYCCCSHWLSSAKRPWGPVLEVCTGVNLRACVRFVRQEVGVGFTSPAR